MLDPSVAQRSAELQAAFHRRDPFRHVVIENFFADVVGRSFAAMHNDGGSGEEVPEPLLATLADIHAETVSRVGSHSLSFDQIHALAQKIMGLDVDGVIVTQGTDTLEETSFLLDLLVERDIPVIVTAAPSGFFAVQPSIQLMTVAGELTGVLSFTPAPNQFGTVSLVVMVSDNQSWVDSSGGGRSTATMVEWERFRRRNPRARLVCLDLAPYGTTQAAERQDILNVGGFSDAVFDIIARFARGELSADHWIGEIESMAV